MHSTISNLSTKKIHGQACAIYLISQKKKLTMKLSHDIKIF